MTRPVTFTARVTDGRLPHVHGQQLAALLRASEGRLVTVSVAEAKRRRSLSANAYLWGVVYPALVGMFNDAGNAVDADDVHVYCKLYVAKLRKRLVTPDGEVVETLGSTRDLPPREFGDYLERVLAFAAEHGCHVPSPDQFHHTTNPRKEALCLQA